VADEDVEVTNFYLHQSGKEEVEQAQATVEAHLDNAGNTRTRVHKDEDEDHAKAILEEARKGYDLLVLPATERRTSGEDSLFDRHIDDVIQESPCPLLVVSSPSEGEGSGDLDDMGGGHILVPVSGTPSDRHAAEVAFAVGSRCGAEVDVVHVVSGPQHTVRLGSDEAVGHAMELGEDLVEKIAELGRAMGVTVNTDVLVADHPEHAIVERAERRANLIMMASSRRPVTQRAFFGHRIDYVVGHAPCPVVVVNPH
jgi:nucleotide-binding universal stress UspA family protein